MIISKNFKRSAAAMMFAVIVMVGGAAAQTWDCGETPGTVTATLSEGTLTISGVGAMADYTYINTTSAPWGSSRSSVSNVVIENGVTSIGNEAFVGCTALTSVTIPTSVTSIGESAFYGCTGLTSVTIPNSVTSIGKSAFRECTDLTSVTIPNSVTSIGDGAFMYCTGLTSVTIPNSVTSIGTYAFYGCSGLTSMTIPNSVTSIGYGAFYDCSGLTSMTIPNSVTSIGEGAFDGCSGLTSLTIGNGVTSIAVGVFCYLDGLTSLTIPCNVNYSHMFCRLPSLTLVTITGTGDMMSYAAGNSPWYRSSNSISEVVIESGVTSIGYAAFSSCTGLTSVTIPNSVTSIGDYAFNLCTGLTSVTIPNSVTSIGQSAFSHTGLTSVTIPNSVTSIGEYAFQECNGLTLVTIPNSVTSIGDYAFSSSGLTSVTSLGVVPPNVGRSVFHIGSYDDNGQYIASSACLYIPETAIDAYRSAGWLQENYFTCVKSLDGINSVLTSDRIVPTVKPNEEATVIAPTVILAGELTVGPNPVSRQSGSVKFFRQGKRVSNSELRIYDAAGNVINKVKISDNAIGTQARRKVGKWDLCDRNGRIVSEGTYLVKGVVKTTSDGKREKISLILSVR